MATMFKINYDELPVSVNNYLKPSARAVGDKIVPHMYESKQAKDFKMRFRAYLKREVKKQSWDMEKTASGHWYLDCVFIQSRLNQDNNNYFKILCDALTGIVINDDKNLLVRTQKVMYDSKNPRFMAVVRPVNYVGIFSDEKQLVTFYNDNCLGCKRNTGKCTIYSKAKDGKLQEEIVNNDGIKLCSKKR